jgi:TolA-binding protein
LPLKIPETAGEDIQYSRTVRALTGQYVEIPFRGPGWVYLGELGSRRGMYYDSRRVEDEGMIFVFRADEAGTYSLKFNRQDFIRDIILNDHVQVLVEDPPRITGNAWTSAETPGDRVYAGPRWPPAVPAAPAAASGSVPAEAASSETGAAPPPESAVSAAPSVPSGASPEPASASPSGGEPALPGGVPEDLLGRARAEYEAGRTAGALTALNQFKERFPGGSDEAWWLYGQVLEANSPERDIRLALEYYRRLVREYPQSARYDDAAKRIAYLERFYFTIQ